MEIGKKNQLIYIENLSDKLLVKNVITSEKFCFRNVGIIPILLATNKIMLIKCRRKIIYKLEQLNFAYLGY